MKGVGGGGEGQEGSEASCRKDVPGGGKLEFLWHNMLYTEPQFISDLCTELFKEQSYVSQGWAPGEGLPGYAEILGWVSPNISGPAAPYLADLLLLQLPHM